MKKIFAITVLTLTTSLTYAQDKNTLKSYIYPDNFKGLTNACEQCHGVHGKRNSQETPRIYGLHKVYLKKQLIAFKNGNRRDPKMNNMMNFVTYKDIERLSNYFSFKTVN